jgi:hypothetical protein
LSPSTANNIKSGNIIRLALRAYECLTQEQKNLLEIQTKNKNIKCPAFDVFYDLIWVMMD